MNQRNLQNTSHVSARRELDDGKVNLRQKVNQ